MNRHRIFQLISDERTRQRRKWNQPHEWGRGDCSSLNVAPIVKAAVLNEECGEVAKAVLEKDNASLKTELIQCAAVCVAWLESLK
jgi:NTP pyrophosphatase (non-canonical NTP hydrolase)